MNSSTIFQPERAKGFLLKSTNMKIKINFKILKPFLFIGTIVTSSMAFAADCDVNFQSKGSVLTGQSYSTVAAVQGVDEKVAYQSIKKAMVLDGWKITKEEPDKGNIDALNGASARPAPLFVMVKKTQTGTMLGISYTNPVGALSSEDAVKSQFCKLVVAAGVAPQESTGMPIAQAARSAFIGNPNLANPTDEQMAKLDLALNKPLQDAKLGAMAAEAKPIIRDVISKMACVKKFDQTTFPRYIAPQSSSATSGLMDGMSYHNKTLCLTVERFQAWTGLALNAFKFEVVFVADDSGESKNREFTLLKQPDGLWLFKSIY